MHSANTATATATATANTTARATSAAWTPVAAANPFGHHAVDAYSPRRWPAALAVVALLGLALLSVTGAEFGPQLTAAAEAVQAQADGTLGDLDGVLAGIRWVR